MNDLYHNIQSTVQDAYVCASIMKSANSDRTLRLFRLGTDELESMFSVIRTITHSRNCDIYKWIDPIKAASLVDQTFLKNPDLKMPSRLCSATNDHSSFDSWTGELYIDNVDLFCCWNEWMRAAAAFFVAKKNKIHN